MRKRISNRKGAPASNSRACVGNRLNNWRDHLANLENEADSIDVIKELRAKAASLQVRVKRFIPKGASKLMSAIVRQRG